MMQKVRKSLFLMILLGFGGLWLPKMFANEVVVADYPWLWQDLWRQEESRIYQMPLLPIAIFEENDVALLVKVGDQLSVLRRESKLRMPEGMWQYDELVNELNQLLFLPEEELAQLAQEFDQKQWSSQSMAFMAIMAPAMEKHFAVDFKSITNDEELLALWQDIMWPTHWLTRSISSPEDLAKAMQAQEAWQELLAENEMRLAQFFKYGMQEMFKSMSANLLYYWLYTPETMWPIYSRNDAIRLIYTFYMGFYEVLDLLTIRYWDSYNAYLSSLAWQGEELEAYKVLLGNNWKRLMALFYDASGEEEYRKVRNRLIFNNNQRAIGAYQDLLLQGYAWFLADDAQKAKAIATYEGTDLEREERGDLEQDMHLREVNPDAPHAVSSDLGEVGESVR